MEWIAKQKENHNTKIDTTLKDFERYHRLRQETIKYKGKDFFKSGKSISESKDMRLNSIERAITYFKVIVKQEYSADDYLKGLALVGDAINKITTANSSYRPKLQAAKDYLVEQLSADADPAVKQRLNDLVLKQINAAIHLELIKHSNERRRSWLRAISDKISPTRLIQEVSTAETIANKLAACETTVDYFNCLNLITEAVAQLDGNQDALKQKLETISKQILSEIILPGKTLDGLSVDAYKALVVAGYVHDNEQHAEFKQAANQDNALFVDFNTSYKRKFIIDIERQLSQLSDAKLTAEAKKIVAKLYTCKTTADYMVLCDQIFKSVKDAAGEMTLEQIKFKGFLQAARKDILYKIILAGKTADGLNQQVLNQLSKDSEVGAIVTQLPEITAARDATAASYLVYLNNLKDKADQISDINSSVKLILKQRHEFILKDILLAGRALDGLPQSVIAGLTKHGHIPLAEVSFIKEIKPVEVQKQASEEIVKTQVKPLSHREKDHESEIKLDEFKDKLATDLSATLWAHRTLSSNLIARKKSQLGTAFNVVESLTAAVAILSGLPAAPFTAAVHAVGSIAQNNEDKQNTREEKTIASLWLNKDLKGQMDELSSLAAQKIIEKYPHQILQLRHEANIYEKSFAKILEDLIANMIANYEGAAPALTQEEKALYGNDKAKLAEVWLDKFAEKLVEGAENDSWLSGRLVAHDKDDGVLLFGKRWNTNSVFARAGLVVPSENGPVFFTGYGADPEKYGYRFATLDEVSRWNFKLDEKANANNLLIKTYTHLQHGEWKEYNKCQARMNKVEPLYQKIIEIEHKAIEYLRNNLTAIKKKLKK